MREEFVLFTDNVLWKSGEVPWCTFPIVRVLPETFVRVLAALTIPAIEPSTTLDDCISALADIHSIVSVESTCDDLSRSFSILLPHLKNPQQ